MWAACGAGCGIHPGRWRGAGAGARKPPAGGVQGAAKIPRQATSKQAQTVYSTATGEDYITKTEQTIKYCDKKKVIKM